ncbi:MAG: N-acetyltransferase family protein [Acidobacteriota bacterium]
MIVREALAGDRDAVVRLAARLAAFGPPAWRTAAEIVTAEARTLLAHLDAPRAGCALLVAESRGGEVLGFAFLETLEDYFTGERHGHVGILAVAEAAEGKGVGRALLTASDDWARAQGYGRLTLTVFAGNRRARTIYERFGYQAETIRYVRLL